MTSSRQVTTVLILVAILLLPLTQCVWASDQGEVHNVSTKSSPSESYPLDSEIAGSSRMQWIQQYAEWIRSFPKESSPVSDPTGAQCGEGQSGPVWFLTGTRDLGKVERECVIPSGKSILVPVLYTVVQTPNQIPCDRIEAALRDFTDGASGVRFSLDGISWQDMENHYLTSSCFSLQDGSTGQLTTAATSGYWIFLPPLPRGRHVIEFGGRFKADGFDQDVTYVLHAQR